MKLANLANAVMIRESNMAAVASGSSDSTENPLGTLYLSSGLLTRMQYLL